MVKWVACQRGGGFKTRGRRRGENFNDVVWCFRLGNSFCFNFKKFPNYKNIHHLENHI